MLLYPALDLRNGKVVRLRQGDPAQQTIYGDDPLAVADRWIGLGAEWLHVVNLDGAFAAANGNEAIVRQLAERNPSVPIQFGGGLRSLDDVRRAFDLGVARIVLGTLAVEQPELISQVISDYHAEAVAIALDARNGQVTTHGWQQATGISPVDLGQQVAALGVRHALYTDVSRDGELSGVNVTATVALALATGLNVIASGGVTSLADIIALNDSHSIAGAVLGTALYEGLIDFAEALRLAQD
ncbi:MAG: 1-(5-phosphoribosyl)-5-[(5-phosphoribosylamino)methylideneamino]imidazole-4-carboxamide isomerase [Chloroflexota bacterium]